MWLHVDASYGGYFCLLLDDLGVKGLEKADSIYLDAHQGLFLSSSCGVLVLK